MIMRESARMKNEKNRVIIGIDGRCAAGKSTLARELSLVLPCVLFHMDDYFLPPEKRTMERLSAPGGNVDHERFHTEVALPLFRGDKDISFGRFDCKTGSFSRTSVEVQDIAVIEGSYSMHPEIDHIYDLRIFLTVDPAEQMKRIKKRNGEKGAEAFRDKWIPMEERYFLAFGIKDKCDIVIGD